MAVERLEAAAGPDSRPLVVLAVDGWDELIQTSHKDHLSSLLKFVIDEWEASVDGRPRVVLVATCREPEEVIDIRLHGLKRIEDTGMIALSVGDFNDSERKSLSDRVGLRVGQRLSAAWVVDNTELAIGTVPSATEPRPDEEILRALSHPLFWGFFVEVGEDEQLQILDMEVKALAKLCEKCVGRFVEKAKRKGLDAPTAKTMLRRIAAASRGRGGSRLVVEEDWIQPALGVNPGRDVTADRLFREARSFGLIRVDAPSRAMPSWSWRYRFLEEFLENFCY